MNNLKQVVRSDSSVLLKSANRRSALRALIIPVGAAVLSGCSSVSGLDPGIMLGNWGSPS